MMLQLLIASFTLSTEAFSLFRHAGLSNSDLVFRSPPVFGSYNLQNTGVKQLTPPSMTFDSCSSKQQEGQIYDSDEVTYQQNGMDPEHLSCGEAFELHKSLYSADACSLSYPINENDDNLLDVCASTFCSKCNGDNVDTADAATGFVPAPGFEFSVLDQAKQTNSLEPVMKFSLPSPTFNVAHPFVKQALEAPELVKAMPAPMKTVDGNEYSQNDGLIPPPAMKKLQVLDTSVEVNLDASAMKSSMVPPGLEGNSPAVVTSLTAPRLKRYGNTSE
jgi:hypothetical protein